LPSLFDEKTCIIERAAEWNQELGMRAAKRFSMRAKKEPQVWQGLRLSINSI
jgi:hypothetical protein